MINVLEIKEFNKELFLKKYKIYKINSNVDFYKVPLIRNNSNKIIYATCYTGGKNKEAYVLVNAGVSERDLMIICGADRKITECTPPDNVVLSLLINSLSNLNLSNNNVKGSLYRVIKTGKEIVSINLKVKTNQVLTSDVKTFSLVENDTDKPKYLYFKTGDYMNEAAPNIKAKLYYSHSEGKNTVNFYDTDNPDSSNRTKTFVLFETVEKINLVYKGMIKAGFTDVSFSTVYSGKRLNNNQSYYSKIMGSEILNLVFKTELDSDLLSVLKENGFNFEISDQVKRGSFNLLVINDEQYYKNSNMADEHMVSTDYIIQNFVLDGNTDSYIFKLKQCLLEMRIKKEAITGHTELYNFDGLWNFGKLTTKNDKTIFDLITIKDNKISRCNENVFWDLIKAKDKECLMIAHNEGMMKISSTDIRVLPNFDMFKKDYEQYKKAGVKSFKSKTARDNYYPEIIDIGVFEYKGDKYYTVGPIGSGVQRNIGNFSSVKKIEENGMKFEEIVGMLKENLVSVNKYSVYPYPFKLMSEVNKNEING